MRIEAQPPVQRAQPAKSGAARRAEGFASLVGSERSAAASTSAPVGLVGGVFAVDEDSDAASGRSRGLVASHDLLDELEGVRRGLLAGVLGIGRLSSLAEKLDRMPQGGDPALAAIIDEIRLRVAVELAKLGPAHIAACRSLARTV